RGCVPKKLLVYASRFSDEFEDAAGYGWSLDKPKFDWAAVIASKDREIARLEAAYKATLERYNVEIVKSRAALEDAHTIRLTTGAYTCRNSPHCDRCATASRHANRRRNARNFVERSVPSEKITETHLDPGRRLHCCGVCWNFQWPRQPSHSGLPRGENPARIRR